MKKIITFIALFLALLALTSPVSARTIKELQTVYNNLNQYLYAPYYNESKYYDEYTKVLEETGELLKRVDLTDEEINEQYNSVKAIYSLLLRDAFDYSELEKVAEDFEKLDMSLFTEKSWRSLSNVMDDIYTELDAPTLYKKEKTTRETYAKKIADLISTFVSNFEVAFNALELAEIPYDMSVEQLTSFLHYCSVSEYRPVMETNQNWNDYQNAVKAAQDCLSSPASTGPDRSDAAKKLLSAFTDLSTTSFDDSPIQNELDRFETLSANQYTESSWTNYKTLIDALEKYSESPHFFYLSNLKESDTLSSADNLNEKTKVNFERFLKRVVAAFENLVPQESVNYLSALCNTYRKATSSIGLEIKLEELQNAVADGYKLLENKKATAKDVTSAIEKIEDCAKKLELAEGYLETEQDQNVKSDVNTIQMIILFTVATLVLSLAFACILSYRKFGGLIWDR